MPSWDLEIQLGANFVGVYDFPWFWLLNWGFVFLHWLFSLGYLLLLVASLLLWTRVLFLIRLSQRSLGPLLSSFSGFLLTLAL